MKHKQQRILIGVLLIAVILTGCGGSNSTEQYPEMEAVDISTMELMNIEYDGLRCQVPADSWMEGVEMAGNTVALWVDTAYDEQQVSIRADVVGYYDEPISQEFMDEVVAGFNEDLTMTVTTSEMRSFLNAPIFYSEMSIEFTEEVIDNLIEQGYWTEEELEPVGGREYYMSIPKTNTIMVYAVVDDNMVTYGGSFYDEAQKQVVLDTINIMIQTTEIT